MRIFMHLQPLAGRRRRPAIALLAGLFACLALAGGRPAAAQPGTIPLRQRRPVYSADFGLSEPRLLGYAAAAEALLLVEASAPAAPGAPELVWLSLDEDVLKVTNVPGAAAPASAVAAEPGGRLFWLDLAGAAVVATPPAGAGVGSQAAATGRTSFAELGLVGPSAVALDPSQQQLFIYDGPAGQIVRLALDPGQPPAAGQQTLARSQRAAISLDKASPATASGLALDPGDGTLYLLSGDGQTLTQLAMTGQVLAVRDMAEFGLGAPQGMVIAPSADSTDDPGQMSLYVARASGAGLAGRIEEFVLAPPPQRDLLASAAATATLIQTIDGSQWSPPAPDTAGVVYLAGPNHLLITDSEVEEMSIYDGANVYESTLGGSLADTADTNAFSDEPTGITVNPANGHLFISDDDAHEIFELDPGPDNLYFTGDDLLSSFDTNVFGSGDPEGVTFDSHQGDLLICDGADEEIYRVSPGGNGVFDGVAANGGDDQVSSFDTSSNMADPEGIAFNPDTGNIYLAGRNDNEIVELNSSTGAFVQFIDVSDAGGMKLAGLAYGPSSQNAANRSIYIADRGIDNGDDPNENDGRVYEFLLTTASAAPPHEIIYLSTNSKAEVTGLRFKDEDIVAYNRRLGVWYVVFDGSDVGLSGTDVNAFSLQSDGSILLSLDSAFTVPPLGSVDDSDILRFLPTSLGSITAGSFEMYFDGSNFDLTESGEDIDAIAFNAGGDLLISTVGNLNVGGTPGRDEDLMAFNSSGGTWSRYFDGSDVGLDAASEDVNAAWVDAASGEIYLSTEGAFAVSGASGAGADVFVCAAGGTGESTACTFSDYWDGAAHGLAGEVIDGLFIDRRDIVYASANANGAAGNLSIRDEDIVAYDSLLAVWYRVFDGSDVGLAAEDVNALSLLQDGSILISLDSPFGVPGLGTVADSDILKFLPASLGESTSGSFQMFFDGSNFDLADSSEDIDAIGFKPDGTLVISTIGNLNVGGTPGRDEDLMAVDTATGSWSRYFDGSDVGLDDTSAEDVNGLWVDPSNEDIFLSTAGAFAISGLSGDGSDVFICTPGSTGNNTLCGFAAYFDGGANGFANVLDGLFIGR